MLNQILTVNTKKQHCHILNSKMQELQGNICHLIVAYTWFGTLVSNMRHDSELFIPSIKKPILL